MIFRGEYVDDIIMLDIHQLIHNRENLPLSWKCFIKLLDENLKIDPMFYLVKKNERYDLFLKMRTKDIIPQIMLHYITYLCFSTPDVEFIKGKKAYETIVRIYNVSKP